jgi:hypothetical protein
MKMSKKKKKELKWPECNCMECEMKYLVGLVESVQANAGKVVEALHDSNEYMKCHLDSDDNEYGGVGEQVKRNDKALKLFKTKKNV